MQKLATVFIALASIAGASTIGSFGTGLPEIAEGNDTTGLNVPTLVPDVWHSPIGSSIWESTQWNSKTIPNGTVVDFYFVFDVPGVPADGTLQVLVDDSAIGSLNGHQLFDNLQSPQDTNCAESFPNCRQPLVVDIGAALQQGVNRLDVIVSQDGTYTFGLDVDGTFATRDTNIAGVPEPSTGLVFTLGLLALAALKMSIRGPR